MTTSEIAECCNPWGRHWIDVACAYVGKRRGAMTKTEDILMQVAMCPRREECEKSWCNKQ